MHTLYRWILKLYPAEYHAIFASEMIGVFDQAHANTRGLPGRIAFAISELIGLLRGLLRERTARYLAPDTYLKSFSTTKTAAAGSSESIALQHQLTELIRNMEFAIAHHDFPKARFYSDQERITRAALQKLHARERRIGFA